MTYANGAKQTLVYNNKGSVQSETWMNGNNVEAKYRYFYDASQNLVRTLDIMGEKMYNITRVGENVTSIEEYIVKLNGENIIAKSLVGTMHYSFDKNGKQFRKKYVDANGNEQKYLFEYRDENNVATELPTGVISHAKSDHLGRKVFDELQLKNGFMSRKFGYYEGVVTDVHADNGKLTSAPETSLIKTIEFYDGRTISYEYDKEERITKVIDSVDGITEYTYDELGQLLSEKVNGVTVNAMTYDGYGNILTKNNAVYAYETTNGWRDKLTSVNGNPIVYDENGNPTTYLGHTLTWEKGRQLKSFDGNTYTYNNNGIRTSKTIDCITHTYTLDGMNIIKETWDGNILIPLYDLEQNVCGIIYNGTEYYFYKNLQGDVIAITNSTGTVVARYTYDAWGVPTIVSDTTEIGIATINPFRYRGYYYDSEIGMYYLQSRYYDPCVGRFVNADELILLESSLGSNLYSYCENCSIIYSDPYGYGKIYSIYYGDPDKGFKTQAKNSPYYNSKNTIFKSVIQISDFVTAWNSMCGKIDKVFLYLHGGKGVLYFKNETMDISQIEKLTSIKVKKKIYLLSCHGGDGTQGENVAWALAKLTNSKVVACTGSVSYSKIFGKYYARKAWDWGIIKTFYYQKKYIFWGDIIAKSAAGQW